MAARGKFIVLEGIDGSGKRTQLEMLAKAFQARGIACTQVGFPNYQGFFGKLVAQFLNGEFGPLMPSIRIFPRCFTRATGWSRSPRWSPHSRRQCRARGPLHRIESRASGRARAAGKAPGFLAWLKQPGIRNLRPAAGRPGDLSAPARGPGSPAGSAKRRSGLHRQAPGHSGSGHSAPRSGFAGLRPVVAATRLGQGGML